MKHIIYIFGFLLIASSATSLFANPHEVKRTVVLVHGAWAGGWQFEKMQPLLASQGCRVYRPTLTGLGERVHLANQSIGLETHITDIINLINFENLNDIILVGHSYGGMVVTGVADRLPGRISRLIYIDALLPADGDSVASLTKALSGGRLETMARDGFIIPPWVAPGAPYPHDVPHPLKTFTDTIVLKNSERLKIPTAYILTVEKGRRPEQDDFYQQSVRARELGWPVFLLEADHNPQRSRPLETAELLEQIINSPTAKETK